MERGKRTASGSAQRLTGCTTGNGAKVRADRHILPGSFYVRFFAFCGHKRRKSDIFERLTAAWLLPGSYQLKTGYIYIFGSVLLFGFPVSTSTQHPNSIFDCTSFSSTSASLNYRTTVIISPSHPINIFRPVRF